jgi:hypothetical protein
LKAKVAPSSEQENMKRITPLPPSIIYDPWLNPAVLWRVSQKISIYAIYSLGLCCSKNRCRWHQSDIRLAASNIYLINLI